MIEFNNELKELEKYGLLYKYGKHKNALSAIDRIEDTISELETMHSCARLSKQKMLFENIQAFKDLLIQANCDKRLFGGLTPLYSDKFFYEFCGLFEELLDKKPLELDEDDFLIYFQYLNDYEDILAFCGSYYNLEELQKATHIFGIQEHEIMNWIYINLK